MIEHSFFYTAYVKRPVGISKEHLDAGKDTVKWVQPRVKKEPFSAGSWPAARSGALECCMSAHACVRMHACCMLTMLCDAKNVKQQKNAVCKTRRRPRVKSRRFLLFARYLFRDILALKLYWCGALNLVRCTKFFSGTVWGKNKTKPIHESKRCLRH